MDFVIISGCTVVQHLGRKGYSSLFASLWVSRSHLNDHAATPEHDKTQRDDGENGVF